MERKNSPGVLPQIMNGRPQDIMSPGGNVQGKVFFTLLYTLYLALALISFIWNIDILIKVNTLLGILALGLMSVRIRPQHIAVYAYMGLLIAAFLCSSFFVERVGWRFITPILFMLSGFGAAMILLRGYVYSWGAYLVFYCLAGYFLLLIVSGVPGGAALKYCSYNGISQAMLAACIPLYIVLNSENKKTDLIPALLTLFISVWGIGRSGILASLVLFSGLLLAKLKGRPKSVLHLAAYLVLAFFVMAATNFSFIRGAVQHYAERGGTWRDEARSTMWTNYFRNLDLQRVAFGANVVTDPWSEGEVNEYNYHSSFISLHSQAGLAGLLTMALMILALAMLYRTNMVLFSLFLALSLRASVDQFIFFGRFDFIPFFFIFYFLKEKTGSLKLFRSSANAVR